MLSSTPRILLATLVALGTVPSAMAQSEVPVLVGGETEFDACGGNGLVEGLDPDGDNFLSVRTGPSSKARELDWLNESDEVFMCDERGRWVGIVYGSGTCGVTVPIAKRKPYRGGCRSGRVYRPYVRLFAG